MLALLAVDSQVVATPTPVPTPDLSALAQQAANAAASQVGTPDVVIQLATTVGLAVIMFFISTFHQIIEFVTTKAKTGGWNGNLNRGLATLYSVAGALVAAATTGNLKFDVTGVTTSVLSLGVALASTFWGYELRQFFIKLMGFVKASPEAATNLQLATDDQAPA